MSSKLNKSLDEILSTQQRRRRATRRAASRPTIAPVGGIQKSTKPARNAAKPAPAKNAGATGESKIMVSNLVSRCRRSSYAVPTPLFQRTPALTSCQPKDVSEGQIKVCYQ